MIVAIFGHIVFLCLHVLAILFGCFGLFITIPLHLIFTVLSLRR